MVKFALFNELSLPYSSDIGIEQGFSDFLKIVKELKNKHIEKIRTEKEFQSLEILKDMYLQEFLGKISDSDLRTNIKAFISNRTITIETPLIIEGEDESELLLENEYFFNGTSTTGSLACAEIWNSAVISFNSDVFWDTGILVLEKENIIDDNRKSINIRNISKDSHIEYHKDLFIELESFFQLDIKPSNFWDKRNELFNKKISLCSEIKGQIKNIDTIIFSQVLSILRDLENEVKILSDFTVSGESRSVKQDNELKKLREFYIDGDKFFFENHIKNLSNGYRIHYFEKGEKIYIGYIGKHLPTKKHK